MDSVSFSSPEKKSVKKKVSKDFFFVIFFRENNIDGVIESTFSVENNSFGALKVHELKQGGAGIAVTEENKKEYVKLYVNYRFMRGIEQQFLALQKGTKKIICTFCGEFFNFPPVFFFFRILRADSQSIAEAIR